MIIGIGIDIVEIDRFTRLLSRSGNEFLKRFAHPGEIKLSPKTKNARFYEYWSARFAVREAFAKAFGVGLGSGFDSASLGVAKDKNGKPYLVFEKNLHAKLKKIGFTSAHVSISHTETYAVAQVVLEGTDRRKRNK